MSRVVFVVTLILGLVISSMAPTVASAGGSFTLLPGGITLHTPGLLDPNAPPHMTNRLTENGLLARNPGIGFIATLGEGKIGITASYLRNCFDRPAGWLAASFPIVSGKAANMSLIAGIYVHQGPDFSDDKADYLAVTTPLDIIVNDTIDIAPLVGIYLDKDFQLLGPLNLTPSLTITPALSFGTIGLKVKF